MGWLRNFSFGSFGGLSIMSASSGSATKVADVAKSMNNSNTIIWIGANGRGMPRNIGTRKMDTKATLHAR